MLPVVGGLSTALDSSPLKVIGLLFWAGGIGRFIYFLVFTTLSSFKMQSWLLTVGRAVFCSDVRWRNNFLDAESNFKNTSSSSFIFWIEPGSRGYFEAEMFGSKGSFETDLLTSALGKALNLPASGVFSFAYCMRYKIEFFCTPVLFFLLSDDCKSSVSMSSDSMGCLFSMTDI